ncbi:MAG: UDP-N-acetylmuramoyl-tripeptide--D-alanyl-D-alanine ligase [Armatimonadetes bacterium]|nr:UDP-N-acetylmuramoyl-tripeptide--D-alanyl-D-alanine ligase [Armatimonadota bacterium]
MKTMTIAEIAQAIGAKIIQGDGRVQVSAVSTDTRTLAPGQLFFALRGERVDAHDFLPRAAAAGAAGLVAARAVAGLPEEIPVLLVDDPLQALQKLAAYNREKYSLPVVAVTGSSGKTTTKDMIAAVLATAMSTLKTPGNLNNEIGLPLTLLELSDHHQAAVVEMAMRGPGEIDYLCRIARPTAAVITNIGEAHFERLGSVESIARAKGELLDHIGPAGFAVLPAESPYIREQAARCRGKVFYFGVGAQADIRAVNIRSEGRATRFDVEINGARYPVRLPLPGQHNVLNALAAVGVGRALGLSFAQIGRGLEQVSLSGMRVEITDREGITVINDAYNANPSSMRAALDVLARVAGPRRKIAVLGDMLELGALAAAGHHQVGEAVKTSGVDYLVTVGELAREIAAAAREKGFPAENIRQTAAAEEAAAVLKNLLAPGDVMLVKGSRGMQMEKIIAAIFAGEHKMLPGEL